MQYSSADRCPPLHKEEEGPAVAEPVQPGRGLDRLPLLVAQRGSRDHKARARPVRQVPGGPTPATISLNPRTEPKGTLPILPLRVLAAALELRRMADLLDRRAQAGVRLRIPSDFDRASAERRSMRFRPHHFFCACRERSQTDSPVVLILPAMNSSGSTLIINAAQRS